MTILARGKRWHFWFDRNPYAWFELWFYRENRSIYFDITVATFQVGIELLGLQVKPIAHHHYEITRKA